MATVTVRGLDDEVRRRLKIRAATNNRSMEAEARAILTAAVSPGGPGPAPPAAPSPAPVPRSAPHGLSEREDRVAELVSQGLTNRQIAAVLYLSERTVESHLSSILRKLGCRRRATVASWYSARPAGS